MRWPGDLLRGHLRRSRESADGSAAARLARWAGRGDARWLSGKWTQDRGGDLAEVWKAALADLDHAVSLCGEDAGVLVTRGRLCLAQRRWSESNADFAAALNLEPGRESELRADLEAVRNGMGAAK